MGPAMRTLVPVNLSVHDAHVAAGLAAPVVERPGANDLDNWAQEAYSLDVNAATTLGFPVGNLSAGYKRQALMFGASRWKDVTTDEYTYRFGVALRAIVVVSEIQGSAALTLPIVAAKVELEDARATAQLLVRGYKGNKLARALPCWQTFGVDSYADYMKAVSNIQELILNDPENVEPELLATTVLSHALPSSNVSVGVVFGLHAIKEGSSLAHCIERLPTDDSEIMKTVRAVYDSHLGSDKEHDKPTLDQQQQADEELRGLRLSHSRFH